MRASEVRVGKVLKDITPVYHQARRKDTARKLNPIPYIAQYFGQKLHINQNEKLVRYGVTHICCVDGFSRKIVGFASMPLKNNLEIYEHVFR